MASHFYENPSCGAFSYAGRESIQKISVKGLPVTQNPSGSGSGDLNPHRKCFRYSCRKNERRCCRLSCEVNLFENKELVHLWDCSNSITHCVRFRSHLDHIVLTMRQVFFKKDRTGGIGYLQT